MAINEETLALTRALESFEPRKLEDMPDLDLYKDQVITYLKKELALFQEPLDAALVTSSIINNYVKDKIVPRPVKKRYSRSQLAPLIMSCILKRALSMQQIKSIMPDESENSTEDIYGRFCELLEDTIKDEAKNLASDDATTDELALRYSLKACVDCMIADRLIKLSNENRKL